ncbi:MAG TPA: S16 family serine protease, partial [Ktedonobacterales bacterium]
GRVLAIGGLKEKAMAAHRAGITKILYPEDNKPELKEMLPEVRRKMVAISTMDDVIRLGLAPASKQRSTRQAQVHMLPTERKSEAPIPVTPTQLPTVGSGVDIDLPAALP